MSLSQINLVFPHQLFHDSCLWQNGYPVYLIEEYLFFKQYPFHRYKLAYHRATMRRYEEFLKSKGVQTHYIEAVDQRSDIRTFFRILLK